MLIGQRTRRREGERAHRKDDMRPTDEKCDTESVPPVPEMTPRQEYDQHRIDCDEQRTHTDHRPVVEIASRVQREGHGVGVDEIPSKSHGDQRKRDQAPEPTLDISRIKVTENLTGHVALQAVL